VPLTREGWVVLIRSYRYCVDDWCYEVPAGGPSPGLTTEEVARRELSEEIGGTAADLRYVADSVPPTASPTKSLMSISTPASGWASLIRSPQS
jgi:8-oxo-dGTP pyrophosphatase MutT (NUDIX family)